MIAAMDTILARPENSWWTRWHAVDIFDLRHTVTGTIVTTSLPSGKPGPSATLVDQAAATKWECPTCATMVTTSFCPQCGEWPLDPRHLTIRGLITQLFAFLVSVDTRIVNSLRCLLMQPGALTLAFMRGRRQAFIGPFKLFLLANVLFFAVQSTTDVRVFSTALEPQLQGVEGTTFGRNLLLRHIETHGLVTSDYAPVYNQAVTIHARSMTGLMVLPFAFFLPAIFWKAARPFAVHVIFSLHFYTFLLLLYCVPASVIAIRSMFGGAKILSPFTDNVVSVALLLTVATYLYAAIGRVFQTRGLSRAVQTMLLVMLHFACFLAYRLALVPITLILT